LENTKTFHAQKEKLKFSNNAKVVCGHDDKNWRCIDKNNCNKNIIGFETWVTFILSKN